MPDNSQRLASLCGRLNEHIKQIETALSLKILQRGNVFQISGPELAVNSAGRLLESLYSSESRGAAQPQSCSPCLAGSETRFRERERAAKQRR